MLFITQGGLIPLLQTNRPREAEGRPAITQPTGTGRHQTPGYTSPACLTARTYRLPFSPRTKLPPQSGPDSASPVTWGLQRPTSLGWLHDTANAAPGSGGARPSSAVSPQQPFRDAKPARRATCKPGSLPGKVRSRNTRRAPPQCACRGLPLPALRPVSDALSAPLGGLPAWLQALFLLPTFITASKACCLLELACFTSPQSAGILIEK